LLIYPDIFVDDQDGTLADSIRQRILTFVLPFGFRIDLNDTKVNACIAKGIYEILLPSTYYINEI
jgi:hypothetical protein